MEAPRLSGTPRFQDILCFRGVCVCVLFGNVDKHKYNGVHLTSTRVSVILSGRHLGVVLFIQEKKNQLGGQTFRGLLAVNDHQRHASVQTERVITPKGVRYAVYKASDQSFYTANVHASGGPVGGTKHHELLNTNYKLVELQKTTVTVLAKNKNK